MTGEELINYLPNSLGFFVVGGYGGVVDKDHQAWIFEGDDNGWPHPITRSEILERDGYRCSSDEAAEYIGRHPGAMAVLQSLKKSNKSIAGDTNSESS
jgi:hypothetical protein